MIAYIESGASSASELVTELIQFQNSKKNRLSKMQASILMAGIMLDTKDFHLESPVGPLMWPAIYELGAVTVL